jgi:hypothetical protein
LKRIEIPNSVTTYDPARDRPVRTRMRYTLRTPRQGYVYRAAKVVRVESDGERPR